MNYRLIEYINGKTKYTHQMNILLNDRKVDWYEKLGKYIISKYDGDLPVQLTYFKERLKKDKRAYDMISIQFITSMLNKESLINMFGSPDMHSEFGEGFDEDDHQGHQYASYIVNVDGLNFHIGYDHRGTSVEVESTKGEPSPERLFKAMCVLVDIYKEKNT